MITEVRKNYDRKTAGGITIAKAVNTLVKAFDVSNSELKKHDRVASCMYFTPGNNNLEEELDCYYLINSNRSIAIHACLDITIIFINFWYSSANANVDAC